MNKISLQIAAIEDLDFIFAIVKRFYDESPWETKIASDQKMNVAIEGFLNNGAFIYYLIQLDQKNVGIIQVSESDKSVDIILIYINPEHRSQGIGGVVMEKLIAKWKDRGVIYVKTEINLQNKKSQEFFGTKGFVAKSMNYEKMLYL